MEGVPPEVRLRVVDGPTRAFSLSPAEVGTVSGQEASRRRRRPPMCYTRRDQGFEEEVRRLRAEEGRRRRKNAYRNPSEERHEEKPLIEKVKEMVGAR
jgi:hypothetical protein